LIDKKLKEDEIDKKNISNSIYHYKLKKIIIKRTMIKYEGKTNRKAGLKF
jgi:hypothetical protein